jgi:hypothetical protein
LACLSAAALRSRFGDSFPQLAKLAEASAILPQRVRHLQSPTFHLFSNHPYFFGDVQSPKLAAMAFRISLAQTVIPRASGEGGAIPPGGDGDTSSFGNKIEAVCWPLLAVAGIFLGLRVYTKIARHRGLWWDDHLLIASWV